MTHVRRLTGNSFRPEDATSFSIYLGARKNLEVLRLLEDIFQIERPRAEVQMLPPRQARSPLVRARRV
jgi:hypothetical protein